MALLFCEHFAEKQSTAYKQIGMKPMARMQRAPASLFLQLANALTILACIIRFVGLHIQLLLYHAMQFQMYCLFVLLFCLLPVFLLFQFFICMRSLPCASHFMDFMYQAILLHSLQPFVLSSRVSADVRSRIQASLLSTQLDPDISKVLLHAGFSCFKVPGPDLIDSALLKLAAAADVPLAASYEDARPPASQMTTPSVFICSK